MTSAAVTGMRTLAYSVDGSVRATRPLTRNVTTPLLTTSGMVSTPVIARGTVPAGTGTSKRVVLTAAVDMVPGTGASSACAETGPSTTPPSAQASAAVRRRGRTDDSCRDGCDASAGDSVTYELAVRWLVVARYLDIHPENPQQRLLQQVVDALR